MKKDDTGEQQALARALAEGIAAGRKAQADLAKIRAFQGERMRNKLGALLSRLEEAELTAAALKKQIRAALADPGDVLLGQITFVGRAQVFTETAQACDAAAQCRADYRALLHPEGLPEPGSDIL